MDILRGPAVGPIRFLCPVCREPLERKGRAFVCGKGHSFDSAKQGYVNLLPSGKKHSQFPGDTKEMVDSRRRFLEAGYYQPLRAELFRLVRKYADGRGARADGGCGGGYYTGAMKAALPGVEIFGLDISKAAIKAAAGKYKGISFAVASNFSLPLPDCSCGLLTDVFSPLAPAEFARVLRPGGFFLYAVPGERHLYGLKEILYQNPYENPRKDTEYPGFSFVERQEIRGNIQIPDARTAMDLFTMTPYYWKTEEEGGKRLRAAAGFSTEIAFDFLVYRRDASFHGI